MRDALVEQRPGDLHLDVRGVAGAETRDQIVVGGQRRLGLVALAVREALYEQRPGNLHLEVRGVAGAETRDQIVVGGQRRVGLVALVVLEALVEQRHGNLHLEVRNVAGAETRDQIVVGGQRRLGLVALAERDALVEQRLGDLHLEVQSVAGGQRQLKSLANRRRLCRLHKPRASYLSEFVAVVKHRHELDQVAYQPGLVAFASQLVIDAVETFRGGVLPFPARPFYENGAPVDQPRDQCRDGTNVHASSSRDLAGARRLPEVDHREVDAALGLGKALQMVAEVLRVVVDQRHQIFQELTQ